MKYVDFDTSEVIPFDEVFDKPVFAHGKFKVGFGVNKNSTDNPVSVCVGYNSGDHLLEVADWSTGDSHQGATAGGDRDVVVADKPFAMAGDTDCHILGVLQYRQGTQPKLLVGEDLHPAVGGSNRFSSFVSETGAQDEDPKPRRVDDGITPGEYWVNRETGHAAYGAYFVHVHRLNVNEGQSYAALTLEVSGVTPETDTTFPETKGYCPNCGYAL